MRPDVVAAIWTLGTLSGGSSSRCAHAEYGWPGRHVNGISTQFTPGWVLYSLIYSHSLPQRLFAASLHPPLSYTPLTFTTRALCELTQFQPSRLRLSLCASARPLNL